MGCFDVYVRGIGPVNKRDSQGRYYLFKKSQANRYPTARELTDTLTLLVLLYGDSEKVGKAQQDFKRSYGYLIPKAAIGCHEHPAEMPETVMKQPEIKKNVKMPGDRPMICKNWGCGKEYTEDRNEKYAC